MRVTNYEKLFQGSPQDYKKILKPTQMQSLMGVVGLLTYLLTGIEGKNLK